MSGLRGTSVFSILLVLGLTAASTGADSGATLHTYQRADGQTFFALTLPPGPQVEAPARNVVVLVDTSASQAGFYRDTALAALRSCLTQLPADTHVKVLAVDLKARPVTPEFTTAGEAAKAAEQAIAQIAPLGSTDMEQGLLVALEELASADSLPGAVLYIGDGISTANLLETDAFQALIQRFVNSQVPISCFGIGPQVDGPLLAALANQTGGNLCMDEPMVWADANSVTQERAREENIRRGTKTGKVLAQWTQATVYWPQSVTWPESLGQVFPAAGLPIRSDRDTVVVGKSQAEQPAIDHIQLAVADADRGAHALQFNVANKQVGSEFAFLSELVELAAKDDGVTMPTLGSDGLAEMGRLIQARAAGMTQVAERAVATGDLQAARHITQAVLRHDPGNLQAQTIERVVNRTESELAETGDEQPASSPAAPLRVAQFDERTDAPLPPPVVGPSLQMEVPAEGALIDRFSEDGTLIDEVEQRKRVFSQMLSREVRNAISDARERMSDDPATANQQLKLMLQNVERAPELEPEVRAQLVDMLQNTLRQVQRAASIKDDLDRAREEELAAARERRMLIERLARNREREQQLMERFNALMDERKYTEAREVAEIVEELDPGGVTPRVANLWAEFKHNDYLQQVARAARWDAYFDALYLVELSAIPFPDDPPIVYPAAPVWEELSKRREKYAAVDLSSQGGAEERINNALNAPVTTTGLDFPGTPLEEVVDFLQDEYDIPIQLDTTALDDVGIGPDEPVTINVRNVSLRSGLRLILEQLDLTYVIRNEVLMITTQEEAESELTVKVYPVADLVLPIEIPNIGGGGIGGGIGGGGGGFGGGLGGGGGFGGGGFGGGGFGGGGGFFSVPDSDFQGEEADSAKAVPTPKSPANQATAAKVLDGIEIDPNAPPEAFWNSYFAGTQPDEATVRQAVRDLMGVSRPDHVVALIQAALRAGQPQPWMYESLGIAMELSGQSKEEIERAVMSAADFCVDPGQLMYIAQYLSRIGLDQRALALYQQVTKVDPLRHEAYLLGLRTAQRIEDRAGLQWATVGILSEHWPHDQSAAPETAKHAARALLESLKKDGPTDELQRYQEQLRTAMARDCIVRVSWTGEADVDIFVEEPGGSTCSLAETRTTGGGLMLGDEFLTREGSASRGFAETYICPRGFSGTYRVRIHRVWGDVAAGKVTVDVYTHFGTDEMKHERQQVQLSESDAIVLFELKDGRRQESLETERLASAVRRQQKISQSMLAQQLDEVSDPSIIPTRPEFELARRRLLGGGAVGFQPQITVLPEGTNFTATAVISADRKYVRVTAVPTFSLIGDVTTFTFAGAAEQVEGDDGAGGPGGGGAGGGGAGGGAP